MNEKVVPLFGADDPRIDAFVKEVKETIYSIAADKLSIAAVLGALRVIEHEILEEQKGL